MVRNKQTEKELQEVSGKLDESGSYGMEEIGFYDEPMERLRKRFDWIEFRYGDGVKNRGKASQIRPDLPRRLNELYDNADEMFVRLFISQMWDMNELQKLWVEYENKVLFPMAKVLSEMCAL